MTQPVVAPFTQRVYERLPGFYRDADVDQGWTLLRYLSLLGDQAGEVDALYERIQYLPPDAGGASGDTSDLTDPTTADREWLAWLGQMLGVIVTPGMSDQAARDAVAFASGGWRAGTRAAMADAARSALTGTRYVRIYDHSDEMPPGDATQWDVLVVTRSSETPDPAVVLDAIVEKGAKPAGVVLHHQTYGATYAQVRAAKAGMTFADRQDRFPTFTDVYDYFI